MASTTRTTVVGVFDSRKRAEEAVSELRRSGFRNYRNGVLELHLPRSPEAAARRIEVKS